MTDSNSVSLVAGESSVRDTLSLDDLRIFLAVARSGSFRSAAAQMFTSQPSLSRVVARLESQLGTQVFTRGPRGVVITESGEVLLSGARRLLDAAATLRREVAMPMATTMKIGATTTSAGSLLAPYLSEWIPNHLDVHLSAVEDSDLQLQIRLENGDCDVAVISGVPSSTLESLKIATVQVMAMMPFGHRLAQDEVPVSVVDLSLEPLLLNGPGYPSTNLTLRAMEIAGLTPDIVFQCSAGPTLAAMAEAGLGVAVFGDTTNLQGHNLCRRQVLDASGMPLRFNLYIAWKRGNVSSTIKEFGVGLATFLRQRRVLSDD